MKKNWVKPIIMGFAFCIMGLCFAEYSLAQGLAKERGDSQKPAPAVSNLDSAPMQVIRLVGASPPKLTLPPPCSVVAINGRKVTVRDFFGRLETVEVEDVKDIKVGDTVVVKNGVMRIGISLM